MMTPDWLNALLILLALGLCIYSNLRIEKAMRLLAESENARRKRSQTKRRPAGSQSRAR